MHSVYIYIRKIRRGILGIYKYCDKYRNVRNYFIGSHRVVFILVLEIERILTHRILAK